MSTPDKQTIASMHVALLDSMYLKSYNEATVNMEYKKMTILRFA